MVPPGASPERRYTLTSATHLGEAAKAAWENVREALFLTLPWLCVLRYSARFERDCVIPARPCQ